MAGDEDHWTPETDWGLDRLAWEDEDDLPVDLDESVEPLGDRRD
jgi:hypothetical protein